jgi:hypothetical protein
MGDQPTESTSTALTRQLLSAIDFEISQRGSAMARHGITTWGLAAATLGLFWASGCEATNSELFTGACCKT